jgi:pimeloyl-ACP methyl ester carboxylesterase
MIAIKGCSQDRRHDFKSVSFCSCSDRSGGRVARLSSLAALVFAVMSLESVYAFQAETLRIPQGITHEDRPHDFAFVPPPLSEGYPKMVEEPVDPLRMDPGPGNDNRPHDVAFVSPLLDEGYPRVVEEHETGAILEKPLLLYLPGFDGTWVAPFLQFPELSTVFDVRCMTVGMSDRSTFEELKDNVIDFIYTETQLRNDTTAEKNATIDTKLEDTRPTGRGGIFLRNLVSFVNVARKQADSSRPVYLMGESFGGILALEVAMTLLEERKLEILKGLVVINAATCFDRSRLASEGPKLTCLPPLLYPFGLLRLLPMFTDEYALPQLILMLQSKALPSVIDSPEREAYMGRVAFSLPQKLQFMPQDTLEWRLTEWLEMGSAQVESRLDDYSSLKNFRILIVAGEKDRTLPSIAEAERLSNILPNSQVHVVEGAGHASTCGSRVDLAALMRGRFGLQMRGKRGKPVGRTSMKPAAAQGTGAYFGMESRYNGKEEGLSPMLYWSKTLYRKPPRKRVE